MTYTEFQAYIAETLWRTGDTVFTARIPTFIREAEARISRDLEIEDLTEYTTLNFTDNSIAVPTDYARVHDLSFGDCNGAAYITPNTYALRVPKYQEWSKPPPYFTLMSKKIYLLGNIGASNPVDARLLYYKKVPPYENNVDGSAFYDDYPDIFMAAVLTRCYIYMRDHERAGTYNKQYQDLAQSVADSEADRKYSGAPINMDLPGQVA